MIDGRLFEDFGVIVHGRGRSLAAAASPELLGVLREAGIVLFRGFGVDVDAFGRFTETLAPRQVLHGAQVRKRVSPDGYTQTVTRGESSILLHAEMHFAPFSPDVVWFYCRTAPPRGGETTVCDGIAFADALREPTRHLLSTQKLRYTNVLPPAERLGYFPDRTPDEAAATLRREGAVEAAVGPDGNVRYRHEVSAFASTSSGALSFANSILAHHQYARERHVFEDSQALLRHHLELTNGEPIGEPIIDELLAIATRLERPHAWQPGDVLMIDNRRAMHGRRAFEGHASREIFVRMARL